MGSFIHEVKQLKTHTHTETNEQTILYNNVFSQLMAGKELTQIS